MCVYVVMHPIRKELEKEGDRGIYKERVREKANKDRERVRETEF